MRVLIKFRHGLGDSVQLTSVIQHLRHSCPDWAVDVVSPLGRHSCFFGLVSNSYILDVNRLKNVYDVVYDLVWDESDVSYKDSPSTKAEKCLRDIFSIEPQVELCSYRINVSSEKKSHVCRHLSEIASLSPDSNGLVAIHYEGTTSRERKDMSHYCVNGICERLLSLNYTPLILDWEYSSPLPDGESVFCFDVTHPIWMGYRTGDAEILTALLDSVSLVIAVDSGPQKVAGATKTPTLAVWTGFHPLHYYGLANNVTHLVPFNHEESIRGDRKSGLTFFNDHYQHIVYQDLEKNMADLVEEHLKGDVSSEQKLGYLAGGDYPTHIPYNISYYQQRKEQEDGADLLAYGDWQVNYGSWFVESLDLVNKLVLDVGCGCGALTKAMRDAGADVYGIDVNEYTVLAGRQKWPELKDKIFVCDAVNLHLFPNEIFDCLHVQSVAEHWREVLVGTTLSELLRVCKPGGLIFMCIAVVEHEAVVAPANKPAEWWMDKNEDPTHICNKTGQWWLDKHIKAGWKICTDEYRDRLWNHPESCWKRYEQEWYVIVAKK
jgi:ubiquinone/menaquinone biosynthesis C-methylase UbiE